MDKYQIFISYRRDGGDALAGRLADRFNALGYTVFFDVESMRSGKFDTQILAAIAQCEDVLLVLPPNALDRCVNEDDWVRKELVFALQHGKNIIPVIMRGFTFPEALPYDMDEIRFMEGVTVSSEYFDAVIARIESLLRSKKQGGKATTPDADPLLTRAFLFLGDGEFEAANQYFERVLDLDPSCSRAYLGKFLAENGVRTEQEMGALPKKYDTDSPNLKKALAFATPEERARIQEAIARAKQAYDSAFCHLEAPQRLFNMLSRRIACGETHTAILLPSGRIIGTGEKNKHKRYNLAQVTDAATITQEFISRDSSYISFFTYSTLSGDAMEICESRWNDGKVQYYAPQSYRWTDVEKVACRYHHTVGLKKDGTVIATGDNFDRSCEVASWSDIVDIACGDFHTVGLRRDGTVVACGGKNYHDGQRMYTVEVDFGQCAVEAWADIAVICCSGQTTFGVKKDGTVCVAGEALLDRFGEAACLAWTDIVGIAAGSNHVVGVRSDGTVVACGKNDCGQCNVSGWTDVVVVACGAGHTVGIRKDGTILATGANNNRQCDINAYLFPFDKDGEASYSEKLFAMRRSRRACRHCGGELKGLFSPKCTYCGQEKDY